MVKVAPCDGLEILPGDVVAFVPPGQTGKVIHRVVAVQPRGIITKGDNVAAADDWLLAPEDILGKVVGIHRQGRLIPVPRQPPASLYLLKGAPLVQPHPVPPAPTGLPAPGGFRVVPGSPGGLAETPAAVFSPCRRPGMAALAGSPPDRPQTAPPALLDHQAPFPAFRGRSRPAPRAPQVCRQPLTARRPWRTALQAPRPRQENMANPRPACTSPAIMHLGAIPGNRPFPPRFHKNIDTGRHFRL